MDLRAAAGAAGGPLPLSNGAVAPHAKALQINAKPAGCG
jgi:hypothetical protein